MTSPASDLPVDREGVRQIAIAAELLELVATKYGTPAYEPAAAEFERNHRTADVVGGLIIINQYLGRRAAGDDATYMRMLAGWRLLGEIVDLDPEADPTN